MGVTRDALHIDEERVGAGYDHLVPEVQEVMRLATRTEGIVLDPTYTGRAMAGLVAAARASTLPSGRIVFLHTGGLPGLFGHPALAG